MIEALLIAGLTFFNPGVSADSLGTETIDGKLFIVHRVEEKETLYGISRRYGSSINDILEYNPAADAGLEIGQVLKIPYSGASPKLSTRQTGPGGVHKVAEKETLFSISRLYGVSIDELRAWNKLTSSSLSVGQELVIRATDTPPPAVSQPGKPLPVIQKGVHEVRPGETMFSISKQYDVSVDELKRWNNLDGNNLDIGQLLFVAPPAKDVVTPVAQEQVQQTVSTVDAAATTEPAEVKRTPQPTPSVQTITVPGSTTGADAVVQAGLAELIEGTEGNRKYLALHRSAPIGTILKVRNEMNNREVFVRVIGKLPDTALTDKLVLKISRSAYDRLGAIDSRFRVEVTYYK